MRYARNSWIYLDCHQSPKWGHGREVAMNQVLTVKNIQTCGIDPTKNRLAKQRKQCYEHVYKPSQFAVCEKLHGISQDISHGFPWHIRKV
jgi:hypothetical protein